MKKHDDNFIMMPTVDYCFKQLMTNPKVRKGFIAALLKQDPESILETTLLPTIFERRYEDDKLSILDVRVMMADGTQVNLEVQVREFEYWDDRAMYYISQMFVEQIEKGDEYNLLKKCIHISILDFIHFPDDICYRTIQFCDIKTGKVYSDKMEFQFLELKKSNEYLDEAYNALVTLSADKQKRLEYEAREKALKDYNSQMKSFLKERLLKKLLTHLKNLLKLFKRS